MNLSMFINSFKYINYFSETVSLATWINCEFTRLKYSDQKIKRSIKIEDHLVTEALLANSNNKDILNEALQFIIFKRAVITDSLYRYLIVNDAQIVIWNKLLVLKWACRCGFLDLVKLLVTKYHVNVYAHEQEAIKEAILYKQKAVIDYLVTFDKYACFDYLLNTEVVKNNYAVVEALIDANAKIFCYDRASKLALHNNHYDIVELLSTKTNASFRRDRLEELLSYVLASDYDNISKLIEQGVNININGGSLLLAAYHNKNIDMVKFLIDYHCNIHVRNDFLLIDACTNDANYDLVEYLLDHGAYLHAQNNKPINFACGFGCRNIVRLLIECGAVITPEAYQKAIDHARIDIIQVLFQHDKNVYRNFDSQSYKLIRTNCKQFFKLYPLPSSPNYIELKYLKTETDY